MTGKLMGRSAYLGLPCTCCNPPRTRGQERARDKRETQAVIDDETEDPCPTSP